MLLDLNSVKMFMKERTDVHSYMNAVKLTEEYVRNMNALDPGLYAYGITTLLTAFYFQYGVSPEELAKVANESIERLKAEPNLKVVNGCEEEEK